MPSDPLQNLARVIDTAIDAHGVTAWFYLLSEKSQDAIQCFIDDKDYEDSISSQDSGGLERSVD